MFWLGWYQPIEIPGNGKIKNSCWKELGSDRIGTKEWEGIGRYLRSERKWYAWNYESLKNNKMVRLTHCFLTLLTKIRVPTLSFPPWLLVIQYLCFISYVFVICWKFWFMKSYQLPYVKRSKLPLLWGTHLKTWCPFGRAHVDVALMINDFILFI